MLSIKNINQEFIETLFLKADTVYKDGIRPGGHYNKILVNAFFEPSTRTQLSFECAMKSLGGKVINFNTNTSSIKKGESLGDTIKTISQYGDIMVLRHPTKGTVQDSQQYSDIPIINAGDGDGEHPTQALLDLYTIYKSYKNNMKNVVNILFVGDCYHSRTIHSLLHLLYLYPHICIYFLPYEGYAPSVEVIDEISQRQTNSPIIFNKQDSIPFRIFDVIYVTRLQKERTQLNEYNSPDITIDEKFMENIRENCIIMHPLPRNEEISTEIDKDPRAVYFKQIEYGVKIRMALLDILLNKFEKKLIIL